MNKRLRMPPISLMGAYRTADIVSITASNYPRKDPETSAIPSRECLCGQFQMLSVSIPSIRNPKYPNELDKQRHREAMSTYDCNGTINVYFPPKPRRTFNRRNEAMDAMITVDTELDQGKSSSWILRSK